MSHVAAVKYSKPFLTSTQIENVAIQSGVDSALATQMRIDGYRLTARVCKTLNLPVRTFVAAMTFLLHTMLFAPTKMSLKCLVGASILLGFKVQDTPKKIRELARALLDRPNSKQIEDLRVAIAAQEKQILESCAFDFRVDYPHAYVVKICKQLKFDKPVAQTAWHIATDFFFTWCPLRQPSHTLAMAAVILSAKMHKLQVFPLDSTPFYAERRDVNECLLELLAFYSSHMPKTSLGLDPAADPEMLAAMLKGVQSETSGARKSGTLEGLVLYDAAIGESGTAEYILYKP